jgi:hypothetical protein
MITNRFIDESDYPVLLDSLSKDEFHQGTDLSFFLEDGTVCSVYEDEDGPILFVRGKSIIERNIGMIQLDIQYIDNSDGKRNMKAMLKGFPELAEKAKANGYTGFFFESNVPLLRRFCVKRLGFQEYGDTLLVKILDEAPKEMVQ